MSQSDGTPRRALVTGGAGFIGSHLVDALIERGDHVVIVDDFSRGRRAHIAGALGHGAVLEEADVRDAAAMRRLLAHHRPDVVYHLAAQANVVRSIADPELDTSINLRGTVNVLEAAKAAGVRRFVFASTGGALYGNAAERPTPEHAPIVPLSPYGRNKDAAEAQVRRYGHSGMTTVSLRFANVYGPRQDASGEGGVVAIFCRRLLAGERPVIFGDGSATRDYVYVGDVVAAALAAGDSHVTGAINIGRGEETSVRELASALASLAGHPQLVPEHAPARDGEVQRSSLDHTRAREVLGFEPRWKHEAGLRATLEAYAAERPNGRGSGGGTIASFMHARNGHGPDRRDRSVKRVLILSADVGEGHTAAARAVAAEVAAEDPRAEVEVVEGLAWLGWFSQHVIRDGYRVQLRFMPWMYGFLYALFTKIPPVRGLGRGFLRAFGLRRMLRRIRQRDPDVVVSTHPAITNVLGIMRKQGRLGVPVVATITDLADHVFWAHRGCDLHVVCYEQAVGRIEPITGAGSVRQVRPLVTPEFFEPCDRAAARARLCLPPADPIVLVSGGGWGVGDLEGAVRCALGVPRALVIVLAGRNEVAERRLTQRFVSEPRVRVLGFIDQMSDLLGAADAIIHSTGGVTAMEALLRDCPVIAYGAPWGHARVNARIAEAQGLGQRAESLDELRDALERVFNPQGFPVSEISPAPPVAPLVLNARARVHPPPQWRVRAVRAATTGAATLLAAAWSMSSELAYSIVARPLHAKPLTRVQTSRPEVGLVVRVPGSALPHVQQELARRHDHASFAPHGGVREEELDSLRARGNSVVLELSRGKLMHWVKTRRILKRQAHEFELPKRYYFLTPRKGFNLGEYVAARTRGARPVAGSVRLELPTSTVHRDIRRGDVVVVTLNSRAPGSMTAFDALLRRLSRAGLSPVSVEKLASPRSV